MNLALTVTIAAFGSWLFWRLKVPAGALIGAIIFTAAFNITTGCGQFPVSMKFAVQAVAGAFIGQRVGKRDVLELKQTLGAGILMFFCMIAYSIAMGLFLSRVTVLDKATALVCAMPAGLSDTAIISADLGANVTQAAAIQTVRTLFSLLVLPQVAFQICKYFERKNPSSCAAGRPLQSNVPQDKKMLYTCLTLAVAEGAGFLGKYSGVPAGALTFAILAVAALNISTGTAYLHKNLKLIAQCITGIIVGVGVTMQDVLSMGQLIRPVLILTLCTFLCNYVCAFLMHKVCKLDISTSLYGSIPAGVSDMALIATDLGGDAPKVSVLQLIRYIGLFSVMPSIIQYLTH